jgi:hypothetical protein
MAQRQMIPCPVCGVGRSWLVSYRGFNADGLSVDLLFECVNHHRFTHSYESDGGLTTVEIDAAAPVPDMRAAMGTVARRMIAERASSSSTESA